METDKEHIDDLIAKYLSGEASPEEAMLLDDWKAELPEHMQYFEACYQVFHHTARAKVNSGELFRKVMEQIDVPVQSAPRMIRLKTYFTPLRIAASILIVALLGMFASMYLKFTAQPDQLITSSETVSKRELADGSQVVLNKNSRLTVVGGFNKKERKLRLEGEAFFEVKHDEEKPFVIDAGGVEITDVGTAFNVKASPMSDSVMVMVTEGIVDMSNGQTTIRLGKDESAVYVRSLNELTKVNHINANVAAYKTRIFRFSASTLEEVIATVNGVYGDVLAIENPKLSSCKITVDFNNESPETMASVIAETLGLAYKRSGDQFILTGDSCIQ